MERNPFCGWYGHIEINSPCFKYEDGALIDVEKGVLVAFCSNAESYTIPPSVTAIGDSAFYLCYRLTSITIPPSVTSIGKNAFSGCKSLTSITIPPSVTAIGDYAFSDCSSLTSITIPPSVTTIGGWAFYRCKSLVSITIPPSVTTIGNSAFSWCESLTSITIPLGVTAIGDDAFSLCESLTSITIPPSVTAIGKEAFSSCKSLTSITIPPSVINIGYRAFCGCKSLTSVTIPPSVTAIGNYAFSECSSLTSITIPPSVTTFGKKAFYKCTRLSRIYCYAQNPPIFDFESIIKGRPTLYVQRESLERYKQAYSAGSFADICPINYYLSYYVDGKLYSRELLDIGTHITPLAEPEKEGHTFSGWEDPIPDVMPTYDVAVGGRFKVNTYKVTYMVGSEVVHVDNVAYGSPIPAYVYSPEDEAVVFRGWIGERYEKMPAFDVVYTADIVNGIDDIVQDREMDVYDLTGMKVGTTSEWHTLKQGTYIVNGRKVRKG